MTKQINRFLMETKYDNDVKNATAISDSYAHYSVKDSNVILYYFDIDTVVFTKLLIMRTVAGWAKTGVPEDITSDKKYKLRQYDIATGKIFEYDIQYSDITEAVMKIAKDLRTDYDGAMFIYF